MWAAVALVGSTLALVAPVESAGDPVRYAVVVGHNGGGSDGDRTALSFADDDAARFFRMVLPTTRQAWLLTTFDLDTAALFHDLSQVARPPSKDELARVLGEVTWALNEQRGAGRRTELILYFAGHGDIDVGGQGYLVLADGRFTRSDLERQVLSVARADTSHVIIDACASYFMVGRGGKDESGAVQLTPEALNVLKGGSASLRDRVGVLVSTSDSSEVHESAQVGGGVFSYLLRSALAGASDTNVDGRIEYAEAAAFIAAASRELADPRARLKVHAAAPRQSPHAALADLRRSRAEHFLTVDGEATHLRILDENGLPYAELHQPRDGRVTVALTGSRFFIIQSGDEEAVLVPRRAGAYALSSLPFSAAPHARSADPRFRGLFARPFDSSFLDGYLASADLLPPVAGDRFVPPFAQGAEPAVEIPWLYIGAGLFAGAGTAGVLAAGALVGNLVAVGLLGQEWQQTGVLDPDLQLAAEVFRVSALGALLLSGVLFVGGGAAVSVELFDVMEERE